MVHEKNTDQEKSNRRRSPIIGVPLAIGLGLALGFLGRPYWLSVPSIYVKLAGHGQDCSWRRAFLNGPDLMDLAALLKKYEAQLRLTGVNTARDLEHYETGTRPFWIKREGEGLSGRSLLCYLLAEHTWMSATNSTEGVKPGDIVVDCGAHVGAFTSQALSRGAAKVIAIEPAPDNAFCLEQNFAAEIAGRQVVVIKKGVWSSEGTLDLSLSTLNSGANSFVQHGRGGSLQVPVTTIDRLVADLRLQRVDYIKMDIEGAEREALRGGLETIGRWHPVLMLEMYHRSDDCAVLPDIVLSAFRGYHRVCGPCEMLPSDSRRLIPHVVYFSER